MNNQTFKMPIYKMYDPVEKFHNAYKQNNRQKLLLLSMKNDVISMERNKGFNKPCWKSVHRKSGYQPDIRGIINGYQEKNDQSSIEYLKGSSRVLKNNF